MHRGRVIQNAFYTAVSWNKPSSMIYPKSVKYPNYSGMISIRSFSILSDRVGGQSSLVETLNMSIHRYPQFPESPDKTIFAVFLATRELEKLPWYPDF